MIETITTKQRIIQYQAKQVITKDIITTVLKKLDAGIVPWRLGTPTITFAMNYESGEEYQGLSWFMLNCIAQHESPYFLSWNQIKAQKGKVIKGSKADYHFWYTPKFKNEAGKYISQNVAERLERNGAQITQVWHLQKEPIFNSTKIERIEFKPMLMPDGGFTTAEECEVIIESMLEKPALKFIKETAATYQSETDEIHIPEFSKFEGKESEFYALLFPSLVHWTGHERRLGREVITNNIKPKQKGFEVEHLIGELGGTYLCGYVGIDRSQLVTSSKEYISFWKKALEENPSLLFIAIRDAQEAVDYILHRL